MNIFVLDKNPEVAATYHIDKHVTKMLVEYAQLMSTAHHVMDGEIAALKDIYKISNINHPCNLWVRESKQNYEWLWSLASALADEYHVRYGDKVHKSELVIDRLRFPPVNMASWGLTPFAQAMPDEYRREDAVEAYRLYYLGDKRSFATWKTNPPAWWID